MRLARLVLGGVSQAVFDVIVDQRLLGRSDRALDRMQLLRQVWAAWRTELWAIAGTPPRVCLAPACRPGVPRSSARCMS